MSRTTETVVTILATINQRGVVYTHFGDDFDNVVALEAIRRAGGIFEVKRCPAGRAPEGEIWVDVTGPGTPLLSLDHHNGEAPNACTVLRDLGFEVPAQACEVADTEGRAKATDYRSVLSLLRYATPAQVWAMAEVGLLMETLTDEQIEEASLGEARDKQRAIVETAIAKLRQYAVSDTLVVAEENILGGSFIAYELGYTVFAVTTPHKSGDGVTFAINSCKPLPQNVLEFAREHGAFVPPHGKMAVLGGFKDPESRVQGETVASMATKIKALF